MTPEQIIFVGLVLFFAVALQAAVGFGLGLFATPLLVWFGIDLPTAVTVSMAAAFSQGAWSCYRVRGDVPWAAASKANLLRLFTLPIGVYLLGQLADFGQDRIKQAIGGMLLLVIAMQWMFRVKPRERVHPGWFVLSTTTSGLLTGLVGMGGPPLVLWVMAHDWPSKRARSYIWATGLMLFPLTFVLLLFKFGSLVANATIITFAMTPIVLIASNVGLRIGGLLSRQRLRVAATTLLILIAIASLAGPIIALGR